jgi:hypothetical protein
VNTYSSIGWKVCPQCGLKKQGFGASQFDMPCDDCAIENAISEEHARLNKAVESGKIKFSDLTDYGKSVIKGKETKNDSN